ncbi:DNA polymerase III subunit delta [Lactobacillus sp. ESL0791]|uniref:DNA polymerase III subunit delta n=1 Tax=Lactobacillus sp. ESL0791 TaxID=2983234 RepID=UPI0023F74CE8|nr:DNA polymerase III subunit delta [Lactobacillus sp. ESL0791]MDF7638394.1 DNA polymerase III subunit delta [Lactobacillus sp. ESL0791]
MKIDIKQVGPETQSLRAAHDKGQLAHSYLFVTGDRQQGINTAYWLACLDNCTGKQKPDGQCQNCRQIISGNHPDILLVEPEGKQSLGIDQVRPLKEELAKSPVQSSRRFFIIDQAEKLTLPAANALLNLLEEPVAPVVTILITNNRDQILPTVRSRTQTVVFPAGNQADGRSDFLLKNGFSPEDISGLDDPAKLDQTSRYFYQECLEKNPLSLVSAHQLAAAASSKLDQDYVLLQLKQLAQKDLPEHPQVSARMLKYLVDVDRMRYSNVSFRNLLDYLALQWKR